jgi:hypothetical protein
VQRVQIYLTDEQRQAMRLIAALEGKTQSEVIRTALDCFIAGERRDGRLDGLRAGAGLWKDRDDERALVMRRVEFDRLNESGARP